MSEMNHMIAKVRWKTSFDWKEKAIELQERLSTWSKHKMPQNIDKIFDHFCPIAQTWKIETLEVDLGKIDYSNLEAELTKQINAQLSQKLIDLVIYRNRDHLQIDIEDHATSQLNALRYFLLHGVMPWSYQINDGSIQQFFTEQLKHNFSKITDLIREIGTTNLEVRKRIAWQIDDHNIKAIIKGLEPNNHEQIIDFSKEIIKIKNKENRIQGSSIDFKKNLWLWIFNYLLTERGTMFNKIAFMKSNIKQMASHYNIAYQELLLLIDKAVHQIAKKDLIKQEFITIINTLVGEERSINKKNDLSKVIESTDWDVLKKYLSMHNVLTTNMQHELNDLMVGLAKKDHTRFVALILSLPKDGRWLNGLSIVLSDQSFGVLSSALSPEKSNEFILRLHFLAELNNEVKIKIDRNVVLEIGLKFLQAHRNSSFSHAKFFEYYLDQLSKKTGLKKQFIAQKIVSANIPSSSKTISNLAAYQSFTQTIDENNADKKVYTLNSIQDLVEQLSIYPTHSTKIGLLKNQLHSNVQQNPKLTLETLIKFARKVDFKENLSEFFHPSDAQLLLQNAVNEKAIIFSRLQKITNQFRQKHAAFANLIDEKIVQFGLNAIIFYPRLTSTKLVQFILFKLAEILEPNQFHLFEAYIHLLRKENYSAFKNITPAIKKSNPQFIFQQVELLIAAKGDKKSISSILISGLSHRIISIPDIQKFSKRDKIVDYLLSNGANFMNSLRKEYTDFLNTKLSKTRIIANQKLMNAVLWKCTLDYSAHVGNELRLKKLFFDAMEYHLKMSLPKPSGTQALNDSIQQDKLVFFENNLQVTEKELFIMLKECLVKESMNKTENGNTFRLNELIKEGLAVDAFAFKKMWTSISPTANTVNILREAISFDEFALWMIEASNGNVKNSIKSLKNWFEIVTYLLHGTVANNITDDFWKLLWKICKSGHISSATFKKFVQEIVFKIVRTEPVNVAAITAEIKKSHIEIPVFLNRVLIQCLPGFSNEVQNIDVEVSPERLTKSINKGAVTQIIEYLIVNQQIPVWFTDYNKQNSKELLNDLIIDHQIQFFLSLKSLNLLETQQKWLSENIKFNVLVKAIGNLNTSQRTMLQMVEHFYFAIGKLKNADVSGKEIQYLLFKKFLKAWTSGNWKILAVDQIWKELIWEVCVRKGINQGNLIQSFSNLKLQLPIALQITLGQLIAQQQELKAVEKKKIIKKPNPKPFFNDQELLKDSIFVQNAGLVLINHYIQMLFERLGLVSESQFLEDKQLDAVHYLQFVATGLMQTAEPELALNKILCGIPLNQPIKDEILMNSSEIEMIEQLITAMIGYWSAIGSSSIEGFRGNWLIRDGLLIEYDDKWELTIEKRAYDLLIHQSPFTFSIIKYPWMNKPLYVQWPH